MKNIFGFSLPELMITLVVVAVISVISVPIYKGYVKRGITSEGSSLLGEINAAQQIYYTRYGKFYAGTAALKFDRVLGINTETNNYFTTWTISTNDAGNQFTAVTTTKEGHSMSLTGTASQTKAGEDSIIDNTTYN